MCYGVVGPIRMAILYNIYAINNHIHMYIIGNVIVCGQNFDSKSAIIYKNIIITINNPIIVIILPIIFSI